MALRQQTGLELISTYGVTLFILAIVIVAVFLLLPAEQTIIPKSCSTYGTFKCSDLAYGSNMLNGSNLVVQFSSGVSGGVNISSFSAIVDGVKSTSGYCSRTGIVAGNSLVTEGSNVLCVASFPSNVASSAYTGTFKITGNYCGGSGSCPSGSDYNFSGSFSVQAVGNVIIYPDPNYGITYFSHNATVALASQSISGVLPYKKYICAVSTSNSFSSLSWTPTTNSIQTAIGFATLPCTATFYTAANAVIGAYGLNYTRQPSAVYSASDLNVYPYQTQYQGPEFNYKVTNATNNTVILAFSDSNSVLYYLGRLPIAPGESDLTSLPAGCGPLTKTGFPLTTYGGANLNVVNSTNGQSLYFALCQDQKPGMYPIMFDQNLPWYYESQISMAAYVYEVPVSRYWNPMFNVSTSPNPSVAALTTNDTYICAIGSTNPLASVSWSQGQITSSFYSSIGVGSSPTCSATILPLTLYWEQLANSQLPPSGNEVYPDGPSVIGVMGVDAPTNTPTVYASSVGVNGIGTQFQYAVTNSLNTVVIAMAAQRINWPYFSAGLPPGCAPANTSEFNYASSSYEWPGLVYDDDQAGGGGVPGDGVYYAICTNQQPGMYAPSFAISPRPLSGLYQNASGAEFSAFMANTAGVSMAAYVYETTNSAAPTTWNPIFNVSSTHSTSVTSQSDNQVYICQSASALQMATTSWVASTNTLNTSIGFPSSSNTCSETTAFSPRTLSYNGSSMVGVFGVNVPTPSYTYNAASYTANYPTLQYTVTNNINTVVIAVSSAFISPAIYIPPSNCIEVNQPNLQSYDNNGDFEYYAVCTDQAPSTYTVSTSQDYGVTIPGWGYHPGPLSMAAYVFENP